MLRGTHPPDDFNFGFLVCHPKKPVRTDPERGDVFQPSTTRPLSIVNTDNRLIAGAFRTRLEPIVNGCISEVQRGLLADRSMGADILDVGRGHDEGG